MFFIKGKKNGKKQRKLSDFKKILQLGRFYKILIKACKKSRQRH